MKLDRCTLYESIQIHCLINYVREETDLYLQRKHFKVEYSQRVLFFFCKYLNATWLFAFMS